MNKIINRTNGFEVKTTAKAGGTCNKWAKAELIDNYNNSDPWCKPLGNGDWYQSHVARTKLGGDQECCMDWQY